MDEAERQEAVVVLRTLLDQVQRGVLSAVGPRAVALLRRIEGAVTQLEQGEPASEHSVVQQSPSKATASRQRRLKDAVRAMDEEGRGRALATAGGQAYLWVEAVIAERKRVLDSQSTTVEHMAHAAMFALALRNVVRSAELARQVLGGSRKGRVTAAIKNFEEQVADAKRLRDVLDHFDDYTLGVGNEPTVFNVFYERGADDHYVLHVGDLTLDLAEAEAAAIDLATTVMLADRE